MLPSSGLTGGLKQFAETALVRRPAVFDRLRRALTEHGTDLVIYDLSPGMSLLERSVLMSVDEVVLPALAEYFSVDGINTAALLLDEINADWDRDVRADKLVVNALNRSFRRTSRPTPTTGDSTASTCSPSPRMPRWPSPSSCTNRCRCTKREAR